MSYYPKVFEYPIHFVFLFLCLSGFLATFGCEDPNSEAHHVPARETIPMAPTKKKAATATTTATTEAETSNLHTVPILAAVALEQTSAQTTRAGTQVQGQPPAQEKNKAALTNQDIELVEDEEEQHEQEDCRCPDPGVQIPTSKCCVFPRPR